MKCVLTFFVSVTVLIAAWSLAVLHRAVLLPPEPAATVQTGSARSRFIPKADAKIHQLVLEGTHFERGDMAGQHTSHLLLLQEQSLNGKLNEIIPNAFLRRALQVLAMRWFWGNDRYFESWAKEEMYGVGRWAPPEFDHLADGYTRQAAYHGLHEVGQMMVDQGLEDMGCTVIAHPDGEHWVIGRNFDFEGGLVFDTEKIMKWVFPADGFAYVSVVWAGMVGAVTGVNEHGVYISLNAAGSDDFKRHGTPSTLVLTKALQSAKTAAEAVEVIEKQPMFITDIFVVADRRGGVLYRVEKSPAKSHVLQHREPVAIANHLVAPVWSGDSVNQYRISELTTRHRAERGQLLVDKIKSKGKITSLNAEILAILRDKGDDGAGQTLHLGNRRAIDGLIATHAVIYNTRENVLFVSEGPALTRELHGFDMAASFKAREPVRVASLPADGGVTPERYFAVKASFIELARARRLLKKKKCEEASVPVEKAHGLFGESSMYYETLGDLKSCRGDREGAVEAWRRAVELVPAYARQAKSLEEKLK
ncbi:MAG TPA: C45 family peptidase [Bdellovibrionales bacterium]|nr:C45 family peptidase [Bdellovibrionales bacterium]